MPVKRWISISKQIVAHRIDPLSVWSKLQIQQPAYLLETVTGFDRTAQYSCLGFAPLFRLQGKGHRLEITDLRPGRAGERQILQGPLLESLRFVLNQLGPSLTPHLPPLAEAMVGYLTYDIIRQWENLPNQPDDDLQWPDCDFLIPGKVICFDHRRGFINCGAFDYLGGLSELLDSSQGTRIGEENQDVTSITREEQVRERLRQELDTLVGSLQKCRTEDLQDQVRLAIHTQPLSRNAGIELVSNVDRKTFESSVMRAQQYIYQGDIFQVVLSQRWRCSLPSDPLDLYRALRVLNPSPHMFYLDWGSRQLVGSSPERLVRVEGRWASTRPIAGTRPRGGSPQEDEQLANSLLGDPKERAEHVMLVDLGRNDLGKVSRFGSVEVSRFMQIEHFSHVMHLVSDVQGLLRDGFDAFDALKACFPAGTLTGAPKVRAMEIIDELETVKRGPYGGVVGYFSLQGDMETCITIRSIACQDGLAYIQAGAGIVADSVPEREFRETENKARALVRALEVSQAY